MECLDFVVEGHWSSTLICALKYFGLIEIYLISKILWPKAAVSSFKHHPLEQLPPLRQQSPISPRIHYLQIYNVVETQDLSPHKQATSISYKICLLMWKHLRCEGKPTRIRKRPLLRAEIHLLYEKPPRTQNATRNEI